LLIIFRDQVEGMKRIMNMRFEIDYDKDDDHDDDDDGE